jgi:hypothetical protein
VCAITRRASAQPLGRIALWPSIVYRCRPMNGDEFEGKTADGRGGPEAFPQFSKNALEGRKQVDSGLQLPLSAFFNPLSLNPCRPIGTFDAASGQVVEHRA